MKILLNELDEVQQKYNYIPEEEIIRIAEERGMSPAELYGVISFYSRFYLEEKPKYVIRVCKSLSCSMNSSLDMGKEIKAYLQLNEDNKSYDNKFELEYVECLGQCDKAPVMTINDEVFGGLNQKKLITILKKFKAKGCC